MVSPQTHWIKYLLLFVAYLVGAIIFDSFSSAHIAACDDKKRVKQKKYLGIMQYCQ
jgi:hypothetical protein